MIPRMNPVFFANVNKIPSSVVSRNIATQRRLHLKKYVPGMPGFNKVKITKLTNLPIIEPVMLKSNMIMFAEVDDDITRQRHLEFIEDLVQRSSSMESFYGGLVSGLITENDCPPDINTFLTRISAVDIPGEDTPEPSNVSEDDDDDNYDYNDEDDD